MTSEATDPVRPPSGLRNDAINLAALVFSKVADGLIDPKIVLPWIMGAAGAPQGLTAALVPVREAGSLLPQLGLARRVRAARRRWSFWSAGAAGQGIAALGIAGAAVALEGWAAGLAILGLLGLLALARAVCSVSHKDALARTVEKTRRGRITGAASSVASAIVLGVAAAFAVGLLPLTLPVVAGLVGLGGGLFILAALTFAGLDEPITERGQRERGMSMAEMLAPLSEDAEFRRFVIARALLTPTAYATPFFVMLSGAGETAGIGSLGPMMIASALASILSAWIWGRLSDRSSRQTLVVAGAASAAVVAAAALMLALTGGIGRMAGAPLFVFAAQIGYEGVRQGRKIHMTDMATDRARAVLTAVSNTAIGAVLLLGAALGLLTGAVGIGPVLGVLSVSCLAGAWAAWGLAEVQPNR